MSKRNLSAWILGLVVTILTFASNVASAAIQTCPASLMGEVVSPGDPKQNGRLNRGQLPSDCAAPNAAPPVVNEGSNFTYDRYTFKNRTLATCISVTLQSNDDLSAAAYLGTFNPLDIQQNYLGDSGNRASAGNPKTFSFNVPSLSDFVVVVTEGVDGAGGNYRISVSGCGDVLVTQVVPNFGPVAGGTNVTISGAGFLPGLTARFGGTLATNVVVVDEFTITATTPAHAAGAVDVVVRNSNNTQSTLAGGFTYFDPITPTISLASDANPSVFGQPVTFTAHVDPTAPAAATGTMTFRDAGNVIGTGNLDANGNATFTTSALTVGTHPITATYGGNGLFLGGTSNTVSQVVNRAETTTTVISSSNPSVVNQAVTFTATVAAAAPGAGTPQGNVVFREGAATLGTVALDATGNARLTLANLAVGTHDVVAAYAGNASFNPSTSDPLSQVVNLTGTTVALTSSLNPSPFGANVTFKATVSSNGGGVPTGSVTFTDAGTTLGGPIALVNGVAEFSIATLAVGTHPITASYGGDGVNSPATGALAQVVTGATTTTTLASSKNPSAPAEAVTFTATVSSGAAGTIKGMVTFRDGTATIGTGTVTAGKATFTTSTLTVGVHPITAEYLGDSTFSGSTSAALSQEVKAAGADAGVDSGAPDAGTPDSGTNPPAAKPDGGAEAGDLAGSGCDCRTSGGPGAGLGTFFGGLLAFILLARRRRR